MLIPGDSEYIYEDWMNYISHPLSNIKNSSTWQLVLLNFHDVSLYFSDLLRRKMEDDDDDSSSSDEDDSSSSDERNSSSDESNSSSDEDDMDRKMNSTDMDMAWRNYTGMFHVLFTKQI